jgi:hypothetical protein
VQVVSCEVPLLIYRLHQIDFRRFLLRRLPLQVGDGSDRAAPFR